MGCCSSKKQASDKQPTIQNKDFVDKSEKPKEENSDQKRRRFQDIGKDQNSRKRNPDTPDDGISDQELTDRLRGGYQVQ